MIATELGLQIPWHMDDRALAAAIQEVLSNRGFESHCEVRYPRSLRSVGVFVYRCQATDRTLLELAMGVALCARRVIIYGGFLERVLLSVTSHDGSHRSCSFAVGDAIAYVSGEISLEEFAAAWQRLAEADSPRRPEASNAQDPAQQPSGHNRDAAR
jgi:hypothetical protein